MSHKMKCNMTDKLRW